MSSARALIEAQAVAIHHLLIAGGVWFGLSLIALGMRLWTKVVILRSMQLDDWFIIVATITFGVIYGFTFYLDHIIDQILYAGVIPTFSQLTLSTRVASSLYYLCMVLAKVSLCILLHRIFTLDRPRKLIIWSVGIVTVVTGLFGFIFTAATCGPVSGATRCALATAYSNMGAVLAGVSTFTDIVLIVLSVKALWKTNMTKRRRISTIVLLLLGAITCIISFVRLIWTWGIPATYTARHGATASFFPITEMGAGLTGTSLSCCRPLLRQWHNKLKGSRQPQSSPSDIVNGGSSNKDTEMGHGPQFYLATNILPDLKSGHNSLKIFNI